MKIAIPTDDGIMLSGYLKSPKGYLVLTVEGGEIINEELRWTMLKEMLSSGKNNANSLEDCSIMIVNDKSNNHITHPESGPIQFISSKEVIITKIIMEYLNTTLLRESNTCCMP